MCFIFFLTSLSYWFQVLIHKFYQESETTFKNSFSLTNFCKFLMQRSKMSKNMRKLRVELHNATFYPSWGPIFKKYFFQKHTPLSYEMWDLFQRWHLKDIEENNHGFEKLGALQITFLQKMSRYLAFVETKLAISITWPNEPIYI